MFDRLKNSGVIISLVTEIVIFCGCIVKSKRYMEKGTLAIFAHHEENFHVLR